MNATTLSAARERPSERLMALLGIVAISLLAWVASAFVSTDQAIGGGLIEKALIPGRMLLLVIVATIFLRWAGTTWRDAGLKKAESLTKTAGLVLAGYVAIAIIVGTAAQLILPAFGMEPKTLSLFIALEGNTLEYLYWLVPVAWGSAAFGEEMVFRGFLQNRLEAALGKTRHGPIVALLLQALIFGALHSYQGLGGAIVAGLTGLILGSVYLAARRNLWAPIILHGLVDTVTLSAIYFGVAGNLS